MNRTKAGTSSLLRGKNRGDKAHRTQAGRSPVHRHIFIPLRRVDNAPKRELEETMFAGLNQTSRINSRPASFRSASSPQVAAVSSRPSERAWNWNQAGGAHNKLSSADGSNARAYYFPRGAGKIVLWAVVLLAFAVGFTVALQPVFWHLQAITAGSSSPDSSSCVVVVPYSHSHVPRRGTGKRFLSPFAREPQQRACMRRRFEV